MNDGPAMDRTVSFPTWYQRTRDGSAAVTQYGTFFIVGCQKSGTTWIQVLLNAHPAICCGGEGHITDLLGPIMQQVIKLYNDEPRTSITFGQSEVLSTVRMLADQILLRYLVQRADQQAVRLLGDKTPEGALAIPALAALYPAARFIHAIRDGRDGAVSGWAHLQRLGSAGQFATFADYAEYFAARHWVPYIQAAQQAGAQLPGRYLELRYEELVAQPLEQARRLLDFLGADAGAAASCVEAASFRRLSGGREPGQEDARSHFRKGVVGEWRSTFDEEALSRFQVAAGGMLRRLGYADPQPVCTA